MPGSESRDDAVEPTGLAGVLALVVADDEVRARLSRIGDRVGFAHEVVAVAAEHGWLLLLDDVEDGLRAARRRRNERWV